MPHATVPAARRRLLVLHGLGRTPRSMRPVARQGALLGYDVFNAGYASRRCCIHEHAAELARTVDRRFGADGEPLYVVTHSMGGLVLRACVAAGLLDPERIGRVVMLAPPNAGSEVADVLSRSAVFRRVIGPAGPELVTGPAGVPARLPPVPFELGVVAGARSWNPLFSSWIGGQNDGKVSVARAGVAGMRELLVVPHAHTFIMRVPSVLAEVFHFLEHGRFARVPLTAIMVQVAELPPAVEALA